MKQCIAVMFSAFMMIFQAPAQNVNFGMNLLRFNRGSVNPDMPFVTNVNPQYDFTVDNADGLEGGFYVEQIFTPVLALQAELLWRFTTLSILSKDGMAGMEWTNGSVAIPVFFKNRFGGFAVMVGSEIGVNLLSDKTGKGAFANIQFEQNEVKDFERITWAAIAGVEYTTRRPGIGVHIRYSAGLRSVWNKKENAVEHPGYDYKTSKLNAWQFGLHWRFTKDHSRMKKKPHSSIH